MMPGMESGAKGAWNRVTPKGWLKEEMELELGPSGVEDDTDGGKGRVNPPKTRNATPTWENFCI